MAYNFKYMIASVLRPKGKHRFVKSLPAKSKILDIGCGNASVNAFKSVNPSVHYSGVDVADFNQTEASKAAMDDYLIFEPSLFDRGIDKLPSDYDAVVWSHNIEHCFDRWAVFRAVLDRLKPSGALYLSFPSMETLDFPSREGTLNYLDDPTHREAPPDLESVISFIEERGFSIGFVERNYRPKLLALVGFLLEPLSIMSGRVRLGTWEYYGFETIIHAVKDAD